MFYEAKEIDLDKEPAWYTFPIKVLIFASVVFPWIMGLGFVLTVFRLALVH